MRLIPLLLAFTLLALPAQARAPEPLTSIEEIAWTGGALWLRTFDGGLMTGSLDGTLRAVAGEGVADMVQDGDQLIVLREMELDSRYELVAFGPQGQRSLGVVKLGRRETPLALAVGGGQVAVVSQIAIYRGPLGGRIERLALAPERPTPGYPVTTAALTRDGRSLYVGVNRGEWGGSFRRYDLASGKATEMSGRKGRYCIWDPEVDDGCEVLAGGATTALLADPTRPDCMIVAGGSSHFGLTSGGIARACPGGYEMLFNRPVGTPEGWPPQSDDLTEPVFALTAAGDGGFWAASDRSVIRFDAAGKMSRQDMPEITLTGRLAVGRVPGLVIVASDVNRRAAVMNGSPLIAAVE